MRSIMLTVLLLAGILVPAAATAGDRVAPYSIPPVVGPHPPIWRYSGPPQEPPFPRSERRQAIWDAGACWSECGAYCAWAMNGCLYRDTQGVCLAYTDACDRYCQVNCRTQAGPFLPIE